MFDFDATLPIMAVQILLLMVILNAVFYKPLGKVIDDRAEYIRQNFAQAKERKDKSESLVKQYQQELKEVRRKSNEVIAAAQAEAQKTVAAQIQAAQQEALAERLKVAQEIETQKAQALSALEAQVDSLSNQILAKLLGPELV
jgi:F-type H+-transporting ATPase subunit b